MAAKRTEPIHSGRTRFARDIVAEFYMPAKPTRKALIICDGCPTVPSKRKVGEFFAKKGYWVFHPRYRGTWESGGKFLKHSPSEDVGLIVKNLNKGFVNIYDNKTYFLDVNEIVVLGASFGGAAALLATEYPEVTKVIALAPLIDWKAKSEEEPFSYFLFMLKEGFGEAYRPAKGAWNKVQRGKFFSPKHDAAKVDASKAFVVHAKDDKVIPLYPLIALAKKKKLKPLILQRGGHFSTSAVMAPDIWKKVKIFLKK